MVVAIGGMGMVATRGEEAVEGTMEVADTGARCWPLLRERTALSERPTYCTVRQTHSTITTAAAAASQPHTRSLSLCKEQAVWPS